MYANDKTEAPLSQAQISQYHQDGFLVVEQMFDDPEIDLMQRELYKLTNDSSLANKESVVLEPDSEAIRSIFKVHEVSTVFKRLSQDARIVEVVRYLLGSEVYLHQSRLNYKPGFLGNPFYWHSDFETWHVEDGMPRMRAISVSVSLTRNTEHNGPLMLIPGSHRYYVSCIGSTPEAHYTSSLKKQEFGVPDPKSLKELADRGGIKSVTGPPGTVTFFDCNVMHGSNSNISPLPRANAFYVYNSIENKLRKPFGSQPARPEFLARRSDFTPVRPRKVAFRAT